MTVRTDFRVTHKLVYRETGQEVDDLMEILPGVYVAWLAESTISPKMLPSFDFVPIEVANHGQTT